MDKTDKEIYDELSELDIRSALAEAFEQYHQEIDEANGGNYDYL